MSSSAIPQPADRSRVSARSIASGRSISACSVTSTSSV
jgi:hypothetical protein